ncbi:hypothetical protein [Shewanella fodinae]|uniref:hypothetical protein n=1 Tax=Shewanella fodinae TaxID=552357 RepID=UPI00167B5D4F|nr:hypothetical protein [Shewanella fodinae]MCL2905222.1 hypothetical protein [Shewanella fodinae]GGY87657.1 head morphogenesis protein [Shewanella fodinae]
MATEQELQAVELAIIAALDIHSHYQHRAASAVVNDINKSLQKVGNSTAKELLAILDELTDFEKSRFLSGNFTTARLRELRDIIDGYASGAGNALNDAWTATASSYAAYEASYMASVISAVFEDAPEVPDTDFYQLAISKPFSGGKPYGGKLMNELLADYTTDQRALLLSTVRIGVSSGLTTSDIVKQVRGTSALNFQDGITQQARNSAEMLVRTAREHLSSQAYSNIYQMLGAPYVIDVATLDGRTSKYCASIDGSLHDANQPHPEPPYHPHCRTKQIPSYDGEIEGNRPFVTALKVKGRDGVSKFRSIGDMTKNQREKAGLEVGQVPGSTTYSKWFSGQGTDFQREWLGNTRYKLYTEGKYTLDRFVDPQSGRQYTIDELRMRDADTFRQIFGE